MVKFIISSDVFNTDLSSVYKFTEFHNHSQFFKMNKDEHYKLIANLAKQCSYNSTLIDIGTFLGYSALALSLNLDSKVITYDIQDKFIPKNGVLSINDISHIERRIKNCMEDMEDLLKSPLIILDVDPHDGKQEKEMIQQFLQHDYKGIIVCDDIHLNSEMKSFWDWVPLKKIDVTKYGHWSGTGIIIFDPTVHDVEILE